jgi:hypothetical protein
VSEVKAFFRHCPSCGRRFHVRLVGKSKVDEKEMREELTPSEEQVDSNLIPSADFTILKEGTSVVIDVEDFRYSYRCGHCGHQWTELQEKEHRLS